MFPTPIRGWSRSCGALGWSSPARPTRRRARSGQETALMMFAQAGGDRRVPNAIWEDPAQFLKPLQRNFKGVKIAWSATLGGAPVERAVRDTIEAGLRHFEAMGCIIEEA